MDNNFKDKTFNILLNYFDAVDYKELVEKIKADSDSQKVIELEPLLRLYGINIENK